jgi:hypothetical protein
MTKENEVVKEIQDVNEPEDFFEKLLKEELNPPKDDDEEETKESDSKTEKETSESESKGENEEESVETLKARIAELERERKGQLDSVVKSRQERSQFKSELSQLKEAVSTLLAQRSNTLGDEEEEKKVPLADSKMKVQFDEDGDSAFVDLEEVKQAIASGDSATKEELEQLKQERAAEVAKQTFQENVMSVINQNKEVYQEAYKNLGQIYEDLNNKIIELQERTGEVGENGVLSQDVALDLFVGSPEEEAFLKEHPGIDPTRVARAFNSKVDLRVGLSHLADTLKIGVKEDETDSIDEKLQAAKEKPGGLANHGNQKSEDTGDLIQRISSLPTKDFENLSDAEVAKIEDMLLREELNGN